MTWKHQICDRRHATSRYLTVLLVAMAGAGCTTASQAIRSASSTATTDCGAVPTRQQPIEILPNDGRLRLIAIGDTGDSNPIVLAALAREIDSLHPAAVLLLGDNFYPLGVRSVADKAWQRVKPLLDLGVPIFPLLGNHDHLGRESVELEQTGRPGFEHWRFPAASYQIVSTGLVAIEMIDTNPLARKSGPRAGIPGAIEVLCSAQQTLSSFNTEWKFAAGHHPLVSSGVHGRNAALEQVRRLLPSFEQSGVSLYIAGHDHNLEFFPEVEGAPIAEIVSGAGSRSRPITRIAPGSAFRKGSEKRWGCGGDGSDPRCLYGFAMIDVDPEKVTVTFRQLRNETPLYSYVIRKAAQKADP